VTRPALPDTDANGVRTDVPTATAELATAQDQLAAIRLRHQQAEADHAAAVAALKAAGVRMAGDHPGAGEAYEAATAALTRVKARLDGFNESVTPDAEAAVADAEERLLEATRAYAADVAEAECDAAAARLEAEYPELVARFEDLKATVAAADHKRMLANQALPIGRAEMAPIEYRVRDIPASAGGIVAEEIVPVPVPCYAGTLDPVPVDRRGEIVPTSRDRATGQSSFVLPSRSARGGRDQKIEFRRVKRLTLGERSPAIRSARLADLTLPPLRPEGADQGLRTELVEIDACDDV